MLHHRRLISKKYNGKGRYTLSFDSTFGHHERGPKIFGVKKGYDYVKGRYGRFQTVITATVANAQRLDGLEVEVQQPQSLAQEKAYLKETAAQD